MKGYVLRLTLTVLLGVAQVDAFSNLIPKVSTAYCTGDLTMNLISADCGYMCTWGSTVFLTGQGNATQDFPDSLRVKVAPTIPNLPASGLFSVYNELVDDVCNLNRTTIVPPEGDDADYACDSAGMYNFHTSFDFFGDRFAWYGDWYGFNIGVSVKLINEVTGTPWATCYIDVMVKKGEDDPVYTSAAFILGVGGTSLLGLAAGLMYKKRRVGVLQLSSNHDDVGDDDEKVDEPTTHFELVTDPSSRV